MQLNDITYSYSHFAQDLVYSSILKKKRAIKQSNIFLIAHYVYFIVHYANFCLGEPLPSARYFCFSFLYLVAVIAHVTVMNTPGKFHIKTPYPALNLQKRTLRACVREK